MNLIELSRALHQLRLGGMVAALEARLLQAQSENMAPIDLISVLVSDELERRSKRLLERRHKQAQFRDAEKRLEAGRFWKGLDSRFESIHRPRKILVKGESESEGGTVLLF